MSKEITAVPAPISAVEDHPEVDEDSVQFQYEQCKTSIDATMARVAVEQAKLDEAFEKTVNLAQGLREKANRTTAKLARDAS